MLSFSRRLVRLVFGWVDGCILLFWLAFRFRSNMSKMRFALTSVAVESNLRKTEIACIVFNATILLACQLASSHQFDGY